MERSYRKWLGLWRKFEFESVEVRDYLQDKGVPGIAVEIDHSLMSIDWPKTRLQAFLETVG
jgi:benzoyl-CoA reductase/2-hydroxyglutaryl-CoA dehydratase subunit BcrC/BadD/HgdB